MALSGNYHNYPVSSFGLYVEWTASQSVIGNYSDVIQKIYLSYYTLNVSSRSDSTSSINGTSVTYTAPAINDKTSGWKKKLLYTHTVRVHHTSTGKATNIPLSASWRFSGTYSGVKIGTITASTSIDLNDIDRSAPTVTLTASNITASSVKLSITSSVTANRWWYSFNGGSTWKEFNSTDGTKKETTVTGLTPNTSYSIQACARKKSNNVDGYSGKAAIKTLGGSVISSVSTFTADASTARLTLSVTVYNTSYRHTLVIKRGSATVLTITNLALVNGANTITLTASQRATVLAAMSTLKTFTGTFTLTTYSGSTQIGIDSSKTATVQTTSANSAPIFSDFTHRDVNTKTTAITEDNQIYIKGYSELNVLAGAANARNGAKIVSYRVTVGPESKDFTETLMNYGIVGVSGNVKLKVEAIDSRGFSTAVTKSIQIIDYSDISILEYAIRRKNEVETTVQLYFSGTVSLINVNDVNKNKIVETKFRYAASGKAWSEWYSIEVDQMYSRFEYTTLALSNADGEIAFDSNSQYSIEVQITDRLSDDQMTFILNKGKPVVAIREKRVGINNSEPQAALDVVGGFILDGSLLADFVVEQGTQGIWTYRKWSSGIAECFGRSSVETEFTNRWGQNYVSNERTPLINYPFTFVERPVETAQLTFDKYAVFICADAGCLNTAEHCGQYKGMRSAAIETASLMYVDFVVKGRWK